jgi:hypothetical protein
LPLRANQASAGAFPPILAAAQHFLVGRFDVNAMTQLCERYYNVLEAPHKELI